MLGIILKILALLGWLLLFVTILLLSLLLLVVIYPISYRLWWEKNAEHMYVKAKASWLMGLLNVGFEYPTPGNVIVKLFGITVYDSGKAPKDPGKKKGKAKKTSDVGTDAVHDVMLDDVSSYADTKKHDTEKERKNPF